MNVEQTDSIQEIIGISDICLKAPVCIHSLIVKINNEECKIISNGRGILRMYVNLDINIPDHFKIYIKNDIQELISVNNNIIKCRIFGKIIETTLSNEEIEACRKKLC